VNGTPSPRLLVTIGTDHHPFDRLMQWIDELIDSGAISAEQVLVQTGSTRPPRRPAVRASLPRAELLTVMAHADVVVGHAGPGTIMDARSVGRRPVVVPRQASRGEVVDDHQVTFARRLAALDKIVLAEDHADFVTAVERGLADPGWLEVQRAELLATGAYEVARRIDRLIGDLRTAPRPRISRRIGELWKVQRAVRYQSAASVRQPKSRSR
jgi:UDP-N-acetylglucosamine transferase subunit ALG13